MQQKGKIKMANIKSSKKRVLIAERKRLRNVAVKSSIKTVKIEYGVTSIGKEKNFGRRKKSRQKRSIQI